MMTSTRGVTGFAAGEGQSARMRELKMAELKFEAPLATFENEEWNDFNDYQTATDENRSSKGSNSMKSASKTDNSSAENFGETLSGSLEDLVNTLDDKITKCFCNYEEKVEQFAPVQIRSQEEIMSDCQMWWTITGNFGNLLPIDWSKSYVRKLHTKALNLPEKQECEEEQNLDLSDDEELAQAFDMHSLIVNSLNSEHEDPVIEADQAITEIECMMRDSPPEETCIDDIIPEMPPPYTSVKERLSHLPTYPEEESSRAVKTSPLLKAIRRHKPKTAVSTMMQWKGFSNNSKKSIITVIRQEIKSYLKKKGILAKDICLESISHFNWNSCFSELKILCPTTLEFITGMLLKGNKKSLSVKDIPTAGVIVCMIMHFHNKDCKFLQNMISLHMYNCGCPQKILKVFSKLHLSAGPKGTRNQIDKLVEQYKASMHTLKRNLEEFLAKSAQIPCRRRLLFGTEDMKASPLGYTFCWDNTQMDVKARHQEKEKNVWMMLWALCYVAKNRVSTEYMSDQEPELKAIDISIDKFVPNVHHNNELRRWLDVIITHTIMINLPAFHNLRRPGYIKHKYWEEMSQKSEIINLGVREENPSTTDGAIRIMDFLSTKVPLHTDGRPYTILTHCDGGAFERMVSAKKVRAADRGPLQKLLGIELSAQEFHKRGIFLQIIMDKYFNGASKTERGTLANIKEILGLHSLRQKVMDNFNHVEDMADIVCEGYICLLAMQILGFSKFNDVLDLDTDEKENLLADTVKTMIDTIWLQPGEDEIKKVIDAPLKVPKCATTEVCCGEDVPGPVVACSNPGCRGGLWHEFCITTITGISPPKDEDWWCSPPCEEFSKFCLCKRTIEGAILVECFNKKKCEFGQWFHKECVGLTELPSKSDKWFCPDCSKNTDSDLQDGVFQYCKGLLWMLLSDRLRRTAIRTGNGEMMMRFWVDDAIHFWNHGHPKYLILMHRMTAGINGWLSERLSNDLIWNRTVSLKGGQGHNIAMDKYNEFLNNDFKENLRAKKGKYTPTQTERSSFLAGQVSSELDKTFSQKLTGLDQFCNSTVKPKLRHKVQSFIEEYHEDDFFAWKPGRHHSSFPMFDAHKLHQQFKNPKEYKARILEYSTKLDRARYAACS